MVRLAVSMLLAVAFGGSAMADVGRFNPTQSAGLRNMQTFGPTTIPVGFYDYCLRYADRCARAPGGQIIELSQSAWQVIVGVNDRVNRAIEPVTDIDYYGVEEYWEYPTSKGDCEDYALLKRKILNEMGYPLGALLMTVGRDAQGGGHAVLTVVTDMGDFILDNMEKDVLHWADAEIYFLKRQSGTDLNAWVDLVDHESLLLSSNDAGSPYTAVLRRGD